MTTSSTGNDLAIIGSTSRSLAGQADTDGQVVALWVRSSNSSHTRRARDEDARRFLGFVGKPLIGVTVGDLQTYAGELVGSDSTKSRRLNNVKSLLSFGHRIGYLPFNVGSVVKSAAVKDTLAERIIDESEVHALLALERNPRNKVMLTLTYGAGLRISEVVGLTWRDCTARDDAGQITVFGKGGKTRVVLLSKTTWKALATLRGGAGTDDPVFWSRKGGALDPSAVHRVVKAAAERAGLDPAVSAHWLRHAHASHALDRGAPIHLVQATLGHASVATTGRYLHARPNDSSSRYLAV